MNDYAVRIKNLTKIYRGTGKRGGIKALDNVSFDVPKGIIFSLLGPNGAGKTTLIKALLGIVHPTAGELEILGEKLGNIEVKRRIGFLPENHRFPLYLTGGGLLRFTAELNGFKPEDINARIDEILRAVKMLKWKKTKIAKYSKGMLQRVGLAQALVHNPDLIFLDEPTDGVDPLGRKEIRDLLVALKEKGKTVFINSHLLSEVEMISDMIVILNKGKIVYSGSVEALTTQKEYYEISLNKEADDYIVFKLMDFHVLERNGKKITVRVKDEKELNKLVDILRENDFTILGLTQKKSSLEDEFISLIERTVD